MEECQMWQLEAVNACTGKQLQMALVENGK